MCSTYLTNAAWHAFMSQDVSDASFLSELAFCDKPTDETTYIMALCLCSQDKKEVVYEFLKNVAVDFTSCRYLFSKCCFDLQKYSEAEDALLQTCPSLGILSNETDSTATSYFGDLLPYVYQLMGKIYRYTDRLSLSQKFLNASLRLNPYLWRSYELLCQMRQAESAKDKYSAETLRDSVPKGIFGRARPSMGSYSGKNDSSRLSRIRTSTPKHLTMGRFRNTLYGKQVVSPLHGNLPQQKVKSALESTPAWRVTKTSVASSYKENSAVIVPPKTSILKKRKSSKTVTLVEPELPEQAEVSEKDGSEELAALFEKLTSGFRFLHLFKPNEALEVLSQLPERFFYSFLIQSALGRGFFDVSLFPEAHPFFLRANRHQPFRPDGMEYYSTTLWHLRREVELSGLARSLLNLSKNIPQAWCAVGNAFSLQGDHQGAIQFFSRSIQIDSLFCYGYCLLGHEYIYAGDLIRATSCFNTAIRLDAQQYNSWYGLSVVSQKSGNCSSSDSYVKRALSINPHHSALLCQASVMANLLGYTDISLAYLNKSIEISPQNPLGRYYKAAYLQKQGKAQEARVILECLVVDVPDDFTITALLANIYEELGEFSLAIATKCKAYKLDPRNETDAFMTL